MNMLIYGLITGVFFGFLLQKGRVLRYNKQIAALRLIDMTIVKFMLSCVIVGMVGLYIILKMGYGAAELSIKPAALGANIIGGLIFGIGWGLLGYCPGTQLGALGEGRLDAFWGILGMIAGADIYAEYYPFLKGNVLSWGYIGKLTVPDLVNASPIAFMIVFIVIVLLLFKFFEKKGL